MGQQPDNPRAAGGDPGRGDDPGGFPLSPAPHRDDSVRFRTRVQLAIMLVVAAVTALVLGLAERNAATTVEQALQREFQGEVAALQHAQEVRHTTLLALCRALVQKARIHAALEDDALDLLYPSARDELADLVAEGSGADAAMRAEFYRFLDGRGAVIPPGRLPAVGGLSREAEQALRLPSLPSAQQMGYVAVGREPDGGPLREVIATPILSTETGEPVSALVLGFRPLPISAGNRSRGVRSGIWSGGRLQLPALEPAERSALEAEVTRSVALRGPGESSVRTRLGGVPHLLFHKQINPGSLYPAAYEVCVYPLLELHARQQRLRWQVLGAGAVVLALGLGASRFLAARLSAPVERLAHDSEENLAGRQRAEAALELRSEELRRAARFSADASHQLKTPVTVLRLGLEELLARPGVAQEHSEEISALVHQTYRLSGVVDDLLLLSLMDAGRLQIERAPLDLRRLIEGWLDDLGALPDPFELRVETEIPAGLHVAGAKRYTSLILQNLLENARKYNRRGGRIRVAARAEGNEVRITIGNTGTPIPPAAQEHIFDRFHRGAVGENVPGHGLGLNLARELARVHGGDLRLAGSSADWTEFELRLLRADPPDAVPHPA